MSRWLNAEVGSSGHFISMRMTPEEKERLERLRGDLRLRSMAQVIRAALDKLEGEHISSSQSLPASANPVGAYRSDLPKRSTEPPHARSGRPTSARKKSRRR